jgi:hypothetical protein
VRPGRTFALAASLGVWVACGGSAFTSAPEDGGSNDAATGDSGEAAAQCVQPPNGVGNEGDFCHTYASILSGCGMCEACEQLDVNDCVTLGDTLSAGFKSAIDTCRSQLSCDVVTSYAGSPCVRAQLGTQAPTVQQNAVKTAYCTACPQNPNECQGFFDLTKDGGPSGLGALALIFTDTIDQKIITTCSTPGSAHCAALDYAVCGGLVFCGNAPHGHCPKGLCD